MIITSGVLSLAVKSCDWLVRTLLLPFGSVMAWSVASKLWHVFTENSMLLVVSRHRYLLLKLWIHKSRPPEDGDSPIEVKI